MHVRRQLHAVGRSGLGAGVLAVLTLGFGVLSGGVALLGPFTVRRRRFNRDLAAMEMNEDVAGSGDPNAA